MKHQLGDIWTDSRGELQIRTQSGTKTYYRHLVEDYLGTTLPEGWTVHHIDFDHSNNNLDNLMVVPTPLHVWIHRCRGTKDLFVSNLGQILDNRDCVDSVFYKLYK